MQESYTMTEIKIPCGKNFLSAQVPESELLGIFHAALPQAAPDPDAEVKRAMESPIDSPPLSELARGKKNAVIIISDHTRPVPSRHILPLMLAELRKNNPAIDITLLVATGFHRLTTQEELRSKVGDKIFEEEKIIVHDSGDPAMLQKIGTLPSGGELIVNKLALEADLLVSEGFIEPHFFAGFSGGRKSVLPGIAARETVLANHCAEFIAHPRARTGSIPGNPIHEDMLFAAKAAKLAFVVNVVIDQKKQIVKAFAGNVESAHAAGCAFLKDLAEVKVPESDIVITSNGGFPLDQNLYQSVKGMTAGEAAVRPGGVIIICAACNDGHGGESFRKTLADSPSPQAVLEKILQVPRNKTVPDQWESQILARVLTKAEVILVSPEIDPELPLSMHLKHAFSLEEALQKAKTLCNTAVPRISVIPDGVSVIVTN